MHYIYDIILNFTDRAYPYEFYEWKENDVIEHIKKIPIVIISKEKMQEIINYDITISSEILNIIKNKTLVYKSNKVIEYALVLTDKNQVLALEFNSQGKIIAKSKLLLDEEEEIIAECANMKEYEFKYTKSEKLPAKEFLTRKEEQQRKYLLIEIANIYNDNKKDKLKYIYYELYGKSTKKLEDKYKKIIKDIKENYSKKHNDIYDLIRLNYSKNTK